MERTPEGILNFWLGPLKSMADVNEDNWRDRMLRWRIGIFARNYEDVEFQETQRMVCEQLHREGIEKFFSPKDLWDQPKGWLAKVIVLDQFGRSVYRGTPLAYENDALTIPMVRHICDQGWDMEEYNIPERMWAYVALSHPEDYEIQEFSIAKLVQWSTDLIAHSLPENRHVNRHVCWSFVRAAIEHSEAVLLHGRFPHRNPILCRPYNAGEIFYLSNEMRPPWSYTQPPQPSYYTLHAAFHRLGNEHLCEAINSTALQAFHQYLGLDPDSPDSLMDIHDLLGVDSIGFNDLYRHAMLQEKQAVFDAMMASTAALEITKAINYAIFKDESASWPPRRAKIDIPRVIDVPALNQVIHCPLLSNGEFYVSRATINNFMRETNYTPCSFNELFEFYKTNIADQAFKSFEVGKDSVRESVSLDKKSFRQLAVNLFGQSKNREKAILNMYELLDLDYSGNLEIAEVFVGLIVFCTGSLEDKLRICFDVFDEDNSGFLDNNELHELVNMTLLRGLHLVEAIFRLYALEDDQDESESVLVYSLGNFAEIQQVASNVLVEADTNKDGIVSREEFIQWATNHPLLSQFFMLCDKLFS